MIGFQMVQIMNGMKSVLDYMKSGQMTIILSKKQLKSGQKCLDFGWSGFQMVGTIAIAKALKTGPFEIRSSKSPDLECSNFRSPLNNGQVPMIGLIWYSDPTVLQI